MKATPDQIINEMARLMSSMKAEEWHNPNEQYEIFGKLDTMSPINRAAFVKELGEDLTIQFELEALGILVEKAEKECSTHYHKHTMEADIHKGLPKEGDFIWAVNTGMKCDGGRGLYDELENIIFYQQHKHTIHQYLCKIEKVINVTEFDFADKKLADRLVEEYNFNGGCESEDWPEDQEPTTEDYKTCYTLTTAVICNNRWFLINPEGSSYARYIYLPVDYATMYEKELQTEQDRYNKIHQ